MGSRGVDVGAWVWTGAARGRPHAASVSAVARRTTPRRRLGHTRRAYGPRAPRSSASRRVERGGDVGNERLGGQGVAERIRVEVGCPDRVSGQLGDFDGSSTTPVSRSPGEFRKSPFHGIELTPRGPAEYAPNAWLLPLSLAR